MNTVSAPGRILASTALVLGFTFFIAAAPEHAAAQTMPAAVETGELLPPGQNTCQAVTVTNIQPHVYGGVLESFDVTVSDTSNSYVGILAQVANRPLPLGFITRWAGVPSGLMIHVDTPDINVNGGVPVQLTLLSSPPGAPTCITTISFEVDTYGAPAQVIPSQGSQNSPQGNTTPSYPTYPTQSQSATPSVSTGNSNGAGSQRVPSNSSTASATTSVLSGVVSSGTMGAGGSICASSNAYRLWFILLLIYVIIVAIVVFAEPWFLESSVVGSTAAILVPLILLLAFWYLSAACRAASWIPVVACVIAIVGLFLAFREYELPPLLPAPEK